MLTRAYRGPPSAEEITETGSVFDLAAAADTGDVVFPFRAVVQAALTSPFFLYRTEIGAAGSAAQPSFRITDHEVASFLSYSVLGQAPSAALLAAADRGELTNAATLKTNVDALLAMPEAAAPLRAFLFQWLTLTKVNDDLYKFPDMFPGFDGVRGAMLDEANAFFTANAGMGGTLRNLLTAPVPAADRRARDLLRRARRRRRHPRRLARAGRLPGRGRARGPELAHAARELRARAAALPAHDDPAERPGARRTSSRWAGSRRATRDLYIMHRKPECAVCHDALDGVGFTFENFDGAGRFRTQELFRNQTTPMPIDATGKLVNTDVNRTLANQADLAEALASSAWVRECASIQAFRYYFGYGGDVQRGIPPVMAGYQTLTSGGTMKDLLRAVASSASTFERVRN